jgi:predicted Zn-dependent peptidase
MTSTPPTTPDRTSTTRRHPRLDGAVRRTVLPHGLQVVTEHMRSSRTFCVGFFAGVGSRHESPSLHGASHFLEHVLFKGTPTRTAEQISAAIESVGGELNAYTAKEHTCFYARVLAADADLAVDVIADMITRSRIRAGDLDAERAVILDEIATHADDPGEMVADLVAAELFGSGGLGRAVIGSRDSITAMNRTQLVRHWRRHYEPSSLVVAAAGEVEHDRLVEQLAELDGRPQHGPSRGTRPTETNRTGGLVTGEIRLEQCTAMLAFPGVGVFDDRRYPLGLLALVLGGGMASRLFVEVRERRGLTYGIDAGESSYSDAGIWSVDWQCARDKLVPILDLVRRELGKVAEHGVTPAELARAKGQMRGQTVLSYEGPSTRMSRLGANALLGDDRTLRETLAHFDAVDNEDVRAVAAETFSSPPVLGVVGPKIPVRRLESAISAW